MKFWKRDTISQPVLNMQLLSSKIRQLNVLKKKQQQQLICGSGKTTLAKLLSPQWAFCNNREDKLIKYRDKEVIFAAI